MLVRRGIDSREAAEAFIEAAESHDPFAFRQMPEAVELVLGAIQAGRRITVYGDYDCDGVCATSVLVGAIRDLGGDCNWFIPDRLTDGYGLNEEAIRDLAATGTSLIVSVDCGVTSVSEVVLARELGLDIIVTDHHQPGPELPDCPILHPVVSEYPFPSLCGAAVAAKLASALRHTASSESDSAGLSERDQADLDLVGLATVADMMPLEGENRHLVREGVKVARRARRIGMAALMEATKVEPSRLASEDFGFRLGPRINAAGRMYRADAGVELFLAESRERASEIATELISVNAERRRVEQGVEQNAKAELKALGDDHPAVVVAGEDWHPGVVGIVASRLVKMTGRPSVVIALDGDMGKGSARSVPGLDLHAAIGETADLLEGFGGHAAAAGLTIRKDRIDEFREALGNAVSERIGTEPAEPVIEFDVVAGGADLGLDLAEELEKLQPFGNGNPAVKLLVPGARIEDLREMGEGKHCRFSVCSGPHRANGVSFGRTGFGLEEGQRVDVVAELTVNHWNGSLDPQLRVSEVMPVEEAGPVAGCEVDEWWERFEAAFASSPRVSAGNGIAAVEVLEWPEGLPGVGLAELISSGERLAVLTADARQRWSGLCGASLARFLPDLPDRDPASDLVACVWAGSPASDLADAGEAQILVTDFASLGIPGAPALGEFDRIVLLDPPYTASAVNTIASASKPVHLLSGPDETAFSGRVAAHRLDLTGQLRTLYRELRDAGASDGGELAGDPLLEVLSGDSSQPRAPEESAALLAVLTQTGLARTSGFGAARHAGVVSSEKTDLSASPVFVAHLALFKEHERFINHFNKQKPNR